MEREPEFRPDSLTYLADIDPDAPSSGHVRQQEQPGAIAASPEQNWASAAAVVMPLLRPADTIGTSLSIVDAEWLTEEVTRPHNQVVVDTGPAGLAVVYALPADGFDVIVNGDHLLTWRIEGATLRSAALTNLAAWSATASWTDEVSGDRRVVSSDSGEGWDASRILLPEVRAHLAEDLGVAGRVLIGLPERHLLVAASLPADDTEFGTLFEQFVREHADGGEEPIDRRVFELVSGELVELRLASSSTASSTPPSPTGPSGLTGP